MTPTAVRDTLELAAEFYRPDAIERAAVAFSHVAKVSVEAGAQRHVVVLEPLGAVDLDSLRLEFANWVLAAGAASSDPAH